MIGVLNRLPGTTCEVGTCFLDTASLNTILRSELSREEDLKPTAHRSTRAADSTSYGRVPIRSSAAPDPGWQPPSAAPATQTVLSGNRGKTALTVRWLPQNRVTASYSYSSRLSDSIHTGSELFEITWIPNSGFMIERRKLKTPDGGSAVADCLVPKWAEDELAPDRPCARQPCLHRIFADCPTLGGF